ncbi:MAG: hypothetical protein M1838_005501 [Thelocarpon superellum]|nr:MAG: hypothetical protein M1838_005501 [Thelocarpon superellum]
MAESQTGLLDLERELTCSICTEVLYQPLTLLDCLHTFCGACLKAWFELQASRPAHPHPYTCPSCRARVRETRPNATVTTLLDMYLQANPGKRKPEQEKAELAQIYRLGESVLPPIGGGSSEGANDEDRRLLEERSTGGPPTDRPSTNQIRRPSVQSPSPTPARQIEHQSSLRSLLSASEVESSEMQEEIMRQIMEEGLLDGIDLSNIDVSQEDEISERIAEAYRRRQRERASGHDRRRSDTGNTRPVTQGEARSVRHVRSRSTSSHGTDRTHLTPRTIHVGVASAEAASERRRRRSSAPRRDTAPAPAPAPTSSVSSVSSASAPTHGDVVATTGSVADLSSRSRVSQSAQPQALERSPSDRSTIDADDRSGTSKHAVRGERSASARSSLDQNEHALHSQRNRTGASPATASPQLGHSRNPSDVQTPPVSPRLDLPTSAPSPRTAATGIPAPISSTRSRPVLHPEPSISCDRCQKQHIEYSIHFNCGKCNDGIYNICLSCYRQNRGCNHWFGFGYGAWTKYERLAPPGGYPPNHPLPHTLTGRRYIRPKQNVVSDHTKKALSIEDPAQRLQEGSFCAICLAFAKNCYWKCDACNEGEWGFCNPCVNKGRCCTHPLLPSTHLASSNDTSTLQLPPGASLLFGSNVIERGPRKALTFSTKCNICHLPIQPSMTRLHCPECSKGDSAHNVCTPCYMKLENSGHVSRENGHQGWRRCATGHRMEIVGFEDGDGGRKRVVVKRIVGGVALRVEPPASPSPCDPTTSSPTPLLRWSWRDGGPNGHRGGYGLRAVAAWSYFPVAGMQDELLFPRGAEIREIDTINDAWFWGVYAGVGGLFPAPYVRVLSDVT